MNRQQLLKRIEDAWAAFNESYAGLSDAQMAKPGVVGTWSVKDILAHVTTWEEEALKALPVIMKGEVPPRYATEYGGINAFNALMTGKKQGLSLSEVLSQMDGTHNRLIDYIQHVPEEQYRQETRFRRRLRFDTYRHYREHAKMIQEWRQRSAK